MEVRGTQGTGKEDNAWAEGSSSRDPYHILNKDSVAQKFSLHYHRLNLNFEYDVNSAMRTFVLY